MVWVVVMLRSDGALVGALPSRGAGMRALRDVAGFSYETAEVPVDVSGMFAGADTMTLDVQGS
jgi:hypothetical protein